MSRSVCEQSSCVRPCPRDPHYSETDLCRIIFISNWVAVDDTQQNSTKYKEMMKLRKVHFDDGLGFSVLNCARQI